MSGRVVTRPGRSDLLDLLVIGGGITGCCVFLVGALHGARACIVERGEFGGATTSNSSRIIHGGLRYLQSLNLRRSAKSISDRSWFLRHFPGFVEPLDCLVPLYGEGLRRPWAMKAAFEVNAALNAVVCDRRVRPRLHPGRVISGEEALRRCAIVRPEGLLGAALWQDALIRDPRGLIMEMIRRARDLGGEACDYTAAVGLTSEGDGAHCVQVKDQHTGRERTLRARVVVNAAGPWGEEVAAMMRPVVRPPAPLCVCFNVLTDAAPVFGGAVGIRAPRRGAHTYFMLPRNGRLLVGTGERPLRAAASAYAGPSAEDVESMLAEVREAVPALELDGARVMGVEWGLLPARPGCPGEPADTDVVIDHAAEGSARGLWSVSGVKLTTAPSLAERCLRRALGIRVRPVFGEPATDGGGCINAPVEARG